MTAHAFQAQRDQVQVEFWFDFSCPYAYLASTQITALCQRQSATLTFEPMLLGGVFRSIGAGEGPMRTLSAAKALHLHADLYRWADELAVPFTMPAAHPMRTVQALRTLLALDRALWPAAIHALYAAYWQHCVDITQASNIEAVLVTAGLPSAAVATALDHANSEAIKAELHHRTARAVDYGIFGAPAMRVDCANGSVPLLFWGQDRLAWVEATLAGWQPDVGPAASVRSCAPSSGPRPTQSAEPTSKVATTATSLTKPSTASSTVEVFFDLASPFAYLGLHQIEHLQARTGAQFELRPILLGALFRDIGQVDVPLFGFPVAKQRYVMQEISRWAHWLGVPFQFPKKFPQRTVLAQRCILAAAQHNASQGLALALRVGHAFWAEGEDIEDETTVARLLTDCGLAVEVIAQSKSPESKQALIQATAAARTAGVFGVPTWLVHTETATKPLLFWGQDRCNFVEQALAGWRPHIPSPP